MNEQNAFYAVLLPRFFRIFQHVTYQGVPICKYTYYQFICAWDIDWAKENLPCLEADMSKVKDSEVYSWSDEPYVYDPHPEGVIIMRGGFGDIASLYFPKERYFLLSPSQAEVDLIKTNRPDLVSHSITDYYKENPKAVRELLGQVTEIINGQKADPIFGSTKLLQWFQDKIPEIVHTFDAIQSLFKLVNVAAVLTVSSIYSMDGALNLCARANRIPSFTLQHGIMAEHDLFGHAPILATKKMVWGKAFSEFYRKFGYPESRTSVIGSPRFDSIFNQKWGGREKLCQMAGIDPSKKIIVYAAQIFFYNQTIAPMILEGLKSIPEVFLLILLHSGDNPSPHEHLIRGCNNCKVVRFGHISLYDALSGADFFMTYYSTAALEAMLFKIPVITVEPTPPTFSFGDLGASLKVTNAAELNQVISRLLSDETYRTHAVNRYQEFLYRYCLPDGLAGKRLFDEIEALCHSGGIAL